MNQPASVPETGRPALLLHHAPGHDQLNAVSPEPSVTGTLQREPRVTGTLRRTERRLYSETVALRMGVK